VSVVPATRRFGAAALRSSPARAPPEVSSQSEASASEPESGAPDVPW
jgi:hypothetical protein